MTITDHQRPDTDDTDGTVDGVPEPTGEAGTRDVDVVFPPSEFVTLKSGTVVRLLDFDTVQAFLLLRVVTKPTGNNLASLPKLDAEQGEDEFVQQLLLLMVMSIPEAIKETLEFVRSLVEPKGLTPAGRHLNKADHARNQALRDDLAAELANPKLADLMAIVGTAVIREAPNLQALGKQLGQLINLAKRAGSIPSLPTSRG